MKGCDYMSKLRSILGSTAAFIYFVLVMWWILLMLLFAPLGLLMDIQTVRSSGFSTTNIGMSFIGIFGLFIGLSLLIPALRKMYFKLPWMFPFVKILFVDVIIMTVATFILNYGYEIQNNTRHTAFFIIMIVQIILCRIAMSIYFNKKPVKHIGGGANEK